MKLELITSEFKRMVTCAAKGAGSDKLSPLTTYLGIDVKDNTLYLRTTDGSNFLVCKKPKVTCENFAVVVDCDSFVNLIKKTTSEHIILNVEDDVIKIKGNGNYQIACVTDEHGEAFVFPAAENNFDLLAFQPVKVKSKVFETVFEVNTASVSKVLDTPVLTGFYFGTNGVMTTDSLKLCVFDVNVFKRDVLLSLDFVRLATLFTEEDVKVYFIDNDVVMETGNIVIYGSQMQDIETYPVEALQGLIQQEYSSKCVVKKALLLAALDRLNIFVTEYEKNGVTLHFTKDGLELYSKKAKELLPYDESENYKDFSCLLELPKLKEQIATIREDVVGFAYGNPNIILMEEPKVIHILSTMEEV